jgi:hypothetical protein
MSAPRRRQGHHWLARVASSPCAVLLATLMVSGCRPEREDLVIVNRTTSTIIVYRGAAPPPYSEYVDKFTAGESGGMPYGAKESWLFGLWIDYDASFRREFSTGLTVADPSGRSVYLSLADLERRRTHPKAPYYQLEIDARDFPP